MDEAYEYNWITICKCSTFFYEKHPSKTHKIAVKMIIVKYWVPFNSIVSWDSLYHFIISRFTPGKQAERKIYLTPTSCYQDFFFCGSIMKILQFDYL